MTQHTQQIIFVILNKLKIYNRLIPINPNYLLRNHTK